MSTRLSHAVRAAQCGPRGSGRTTAIANAAKAISATVVAADQQSADRIEERYYVSATVIGLGMVGSHGPYLFDHDAIARLLSEADSEIRRLTRERDEALAELDEEQHRELS